MWLGRLNQNTIPKLYCLPFGEICFIGYYVFFLSMNLQFHYQVKNTVNSTFATSILGGKVYQGRIAASLHIEEITKM